MKYLRCKYEADFISLSAKAENFIMTMSLFHTRLLPSISFSSGACAVITKNLKGKLLNPTVRKKPHLLYKQGFFNEIHSYGMSEIFLRNMKYTSCMKYAAHMMCA